MTMLAAVSDQYGSPDILRIETVKKPVPKNHEVLIKVFATTVNRTDCAVLSGKPLIFRLFTGVIHPKRSVQGTDFAGEIVSAGKNVTKFREGDRVFGFDDVGLSSHAQYLTLSENNAIATIPDHITYEHAAASIEGAHYALNFLNKLDIKKGQKVLVNGATGAIGSAAVQLLNYYGAKVTAVCRKKDEDLVKSIGAVKVIDYINEDFTRPEEKYKFVFDAVGKSSFSRCKPILERGGIYISSEPGRMAQNIFLPMITAVFDTKKVVFPFPLDRAGSVLFMQKLLREGKFLPVIDRRYSLEEIADAYRYVGKGQKTGNVIISVQH